MKRIISLALAALMATVVLAGCGSNASSSTSSTASGNSSSNSSAATTDESWTKVENAGKFVLGLDAEFPPMGYKDTETGEITGFDIDIAKEVFKRLNVEFVAQPINWDNKQLELDGGNIDCIWNGMSWTQERADSMECSPAYMKNNQILLSLAGSEYTTMDSLKGQAIGVQKDSSAESALNNEENKSFKDSLGQVVGQENYTTGTLELKNGSVVALAIDEIVAKEYIKKNPDTYQIVKDSTGKDASLSAEDYVIGFRKGDTALMNKVWDTLKEMKADGSLADISNKWFGEDITTVA